MLDWIKSILDNYTNGMYFPNIHIKDVIEILIVAVIVYEIMLWIKNTKAWMLLKNLCLEYQTTLPLILYTILNLEICTKL